MSQEEGLELEGTPPPVEEGAPTWTVTFGDMMSLLLTFFILMFSMSELKMDRFMLASQSMREAMGGTAEQDIDDPMGLMPDEVDPNLKLENPGKAQGASDGAAEAEAGAAEGPWLESMVDAYAEMIAKRLREFIEERDLQNKLEVEKAGEGVYLRIQSSALFASGSAVVTGQSQPIVEELALITREIAIGVVVSGHADTQPISTPQFPSNWELSAARAAGVARFLIEGGHEPTKVRVESWGEYKPVTDNATASGRAQNRRVELFYDREDIISAVMAWADAAELPPEDEPSGDPGRAESGVSGGV